MVVAAIVVQNAVAAVVAVSAGWPAEFGTHHDPDHVSDQWVSSGTAISAPVAPLVALLVFAALVATGRRRIAFIGALGATLVGVVFIIGVFGEPTTFHPRTGVEALFHVIGLLLALALALTGSRAAWRWLRRPPLQTASL
jgi:hypothetical protein